MEETGTLQSLERFLSWTLVGWIIGTMLTIVGLVTRDALIGKTCFAICAISLLLKIALWGITTKQGFWIRVLVLTCAAPIMLLFVEACRWADTRALSSPIGDLRLTSPEDLEAYFTNHPSHPSIHGLLLRIENHRTTNVAMCRAIVRDARSFDSKNSTFRESHGFKPVQVAFHKELLAGHSSEDRWLVRITDDHLEIGDTSGEGVLKWPGADASNKQVWLLRISIEGEPLKPWNFAIRVEWPKGAELLRMTRETV